jgi:hypothetical protein
MASFGNGGLDAVLAQFKYPDISADGFKKWLAPLPPLCSAGAETHAARNGGFIVERLGREGENDLSHRQHRLGQAAACRGKNARTPSVSALKMLV